MATSQHLWRNPGAESQHVEQEVMKTTPNHVEQEIVKTTPKHVEQEMMKTIPKHVEQEMMKTTPKHVEQEMMKTIPKHVEQEMMKTIPKHVEQEIMKTTPNHMEQENMKITPNHVEQEIMKTIAQAAANRHNENGAPAAEKGQGEKKVEHNFMAAAVTLKKRKFHQKQLKPIDENHPHIGFLHAHVPAMKIAATIGDQDGNTCGLTFCIGSPSRRRKIAHSDPVRWKIKGQPVTLAEEKVHYLHDFSTEAPAITIEQQLQALLLPPTLWIAPAHPQLTLADIAHPAGGGSSSERGVSAPNSNNSIHHVVPALTQVPAPASAIIDMVVKVSSTTTTTDQLQNSRSAAAPVQLDPVVFEPGWLPWGQVNLRDEAHRRNRSIHVYPTVDM